MEKIAIVGSGLMGSAMAWPLTDNGYEVNLVGTHLDDDIIHSCKQNRFHPRLKRQLPNNVTPFYLSELDDALKDVAFIVSGVNSNGVRWIGETLAPKVDQNTKIIAITKGLEATEKGELIILPDVMRTQFPAQIQDNISIAAVGGPCIAGELAGRRQSCVYFGSRELETVNMFRAYFYTDYYHVWTTNDIRSLELAVALKNAYALGVGVAAGMLQVAGGADPAGAYMHNLAAAFFARGCKEIHNMLAAQKANPEFAYSLPGAGDLYVTSAGGRSVTLGRLMGTGLRYDQASSQLAGETLESALVIQQIGKALPALYEMGKLHKEDFPMMNFLVDLVVNNQNPNLDLDIFFNDVVV